MLKTKESHIYLDPFTTLKGESVQMDIYIFSPLYFKLGFVCSSGRRMNIPGRIAGFCSTLEMLWKHYLNRNIYEAKKQKNREPSCALLILNDSSFTLFLILMHGTFLAHSNHIEEKDARCLKSYFILPAKFIKFCGCKEHQIIMDHVFPNINFQ